MPSAWNPKACGVLKCRVAAVVVIDAAVHRLASERFGSLTTGFGSGLCTAHWRGLFPLALPGPETGRDAPGAGMLPADAALGVAGALVDAARQRGKKRAGEGKKPG